MRTRRIIVGLGASRTSVILNLGVFGIAGKGAIIALPPMCIGEAEGVRGSPGEELVTRV
jgi:hypothetical protein